MCGARYRYLFMLPLRPSYLPNFRLGARQGGAARGPRATALRVQRSGPPLPQACAAELGTFSLGGRGGRKCPILPPPGLRNDSM